MTFQPIIQSTKNHKFIFTHPKPLLLPLLPPHHYLPIFNLPYLLDLTKNHNTNSPNPPSSIQLFTPFTFTTSPTQSNLSYLFSHFFWYFKSHHSFFNFLFLFHSFLLQSLFSQYSPSRNSLISFTSLYSPNNFFLSPILSYLILPNN